MTIKQSSRSDVVRNIEETIGFPITEDSRLTDEILSSVIRRHAAIVCPCSRTTLKNSLSECLKYLYAEEDIAKIDEIIDNLVVYGDLLELQDVTTDELNVKGTWVFIAPPAYVRKRDGSFFLLGIVPDMEELLPISLLERIIYHKFLRTIKELEGENLEEKLQNIGFISIQEDSWLKYPKKYTPENLILDLERRLIEAPKSSAIKDLLIIDQSKPVTWYKNRWVSPNQSHTGSYVARRPQDYGPPIWCFVLLTDGVIKSFLDFPLPRTKIRGCDTAWQLQMAIDYCHHSPQEYRKRYVDNDVIFDFFSPLPKWCERRFLLLGHHEKAYNCLLSYKIPKQAAEIEERHMQEYFWLTKSLDSE